MDFLTHLLAVIGILALMTVYSLKRNRSNTDKSKRNEAPEPAGAWPFIGHLHLLGGEEQPVARTLGAMADKHGPVFSLRLGSHRALVVSSWEMVKDCFTTNDRIFASRPSMALGKYVGYNNAVFALAPLGPYWREIRKMVTLELFTAHRLEKLRHVRASEVDSGIKDLYLFCSENGEIPGKVGLSKWFEHLTFNISVRMLAGKRIPDSVGGKSDGEDWRFKGAIKRALFLSGVFVVSDFIPWLEWLDIGGYVRAMKETGEETDRTIGKWLEEHILKRMEGGNNVDGDLMDTMLSNLGEDTIMSSHKRDTIIKATTLILIMTGSESTAETLIWALSLLLNNRHVLKTAQDELDVHVGRNKWVEESDINNLIYLQAIVKETLRLYPPGPLAGPREAMEDCLVGGYHVPKGTRLIVNLWKLQRDSRIWSEPGEFQPERFVGTHSDVNFRGQCFEYIPFSSGRRMCPGLTFGLQVVQLILARLLQGFDISTPMDMPVDMSEGLGIALPKVKPLEVFLTPRLPSKLYQSI